MPVLTYQVQHHINAHKAVEQNGETATLPTGKGDQRKNGRADEPHNGADGRESITAGENLCQRGDQNTQRGNACTDGDTGAEDLHGRERYPGVGSRFAGVSGI